MLTPTETDPTRRKRSLEFSFDPKIRQDHINNVAFGRNIFHGLGKTSCRVEQPKSIYKNSINAKCTFLYFGKLLKTALLIIIYFNKMNFFSR